MTQHDRNEREEIMADFVAALLAVNLWSLEKSFTIYDGLKNAGLCDAEAVSQMSIADIAPRLLSAGYTRKPFHVNLMADRLMHASIMLAGGDLDRLLAWEKSGHIAELDETVLSLKGVGPRVLANYKLLRGIK